MFFRGESIGDGVLQGMQEWHDKYVAFYSIHQPGTPADTLQQNRCAKSDQFTKKTPPGRQNDTNQMQAVAVALSLAVAALPNLSLQQSMLVH
jgi:hypothetical protein